MRDLADLSERQRIGLRALLDHAVTHIPYWRDRLAGHWPLLDPTSEPLTALAGIPVLTRAEIQRDREQMRWPSPPGKVLRHRSGGTTDDNLDFYWGRGRQSWDRAMRYRGLARLGIFPGDRVLHLWPGYPRASPHPMKAALAAGLRWLRDWLVSDVVLDPRPLTPTRLTAALAYWRRYEPRAVVAYPSWLVRLARLVRSSGRGFHSPGMRLLLCTGEPLFDFQRRLLEETFQVRVAQEYGSQDAGLIAHEGADGVLRLNGEQMIVEVLRQGRPAPPGEPGEVVVTHFHTEIMPFIRYATGDIVCPPEDAANRATPGPPSFPLPQGRSSDQLVTSDGGVQLMRPVVETLVAEAGFDEFSLFQSEMGQLTILEVVGYNRGDRPRGDAEAILRSFLGPLRIDWQEGRRFAPLRSGKRRYVCSPAALRLLAHDQESGMSHARAWPQRLLGQAKQ